MILDENGLNVLRSHPHGTKLWLSVYQPQTLCAAQVTGSVSIGDMDVHLYGVSAGAIGNIYSGSTVMVGSEAGKDDIGRIRVRTVSGSVINVAENSIDWKVGQHVTAIKQIDINAIYPRIIQNPSNPEDVIFFKDYNINYTDQNSIMGSLICMGSHYAGFLDNGSHDVYYTATGTVNVNDSALTYLWEFEGGTPTGSTALTPGNVAYDTPGHYQTKLTTTSAQGAVDVSYRYISIYDRPENGTNVPILNWSLQDFSGSRSEGGYTLSMIVRENIDQIQPNAIIVIFADEFYGTTDGSIGGNQPNRESIKFVGYVLEDSITYNYKTSQVTFRVGSVSEVMKQAEGFSVSVEAKSSPSTWFEIQDMDVQKAIYHYVKWHSTVNLVTDIQYTGRNTKFQYFDADRTSLYDALYSLVSIGLLGSVVADRQGKLWIEIEPRGNEAPLNYPTAMNLLKQDWVDSPSIQEKRSSKSSFIETGGIAWSGTSTGTFSAHLSNAPSETPLYKGSHRAEKGLILTGQDQLNSIAGNMLAMENSKFPEIDFGLNGNYSNLDIAPIEFVQPFIAPEDTFRNKRIQDEKYKIERMDWSYDPVRGLFRPNISVTHVTTGSAGITILIPDVPDDSGFSVPNFQLPPVPGFFPGDNFTAAQSGTVAGIASSTHHNEPAIYATAYSIGGDGGYSESNGITLVNNFTQAGGSPEDSTATPDSDGVYAISIMAKGYVSPGGIINVSITVGGKMITEAEYNKDSGDIDTNWGTANAHITVYMEASTVVIGHIGWSGASFSGTGGFKVMDIHRVGA